MRTVMGLAVAGIVLSVEFVTPVVAAQCSDDSVLPSYFYS